MSIIESAQSPRYSNHTTQRGAGAGGAIRTYISAFSNRFFRLSLIASFDILLIKVRSETPTSFFLVLSKTAFFANCVFSFPPPACLELPASFLRPARLLTAYAKSQSVYALLHRGDVSVVLPWLMPESAHKSKYYTSRHHSRKR